jgi:hypothetical protein
LSEATKVAHQNKNEGTIKMQRTFRMQAILAATLLAMGAAQIGSADNGGGGGGGVRLQATLNGPAIHRIRPEGNAEFRFDQSDRLRLKVEVENVNLPIGTVLTVTVEHAGMSTTAGKIILSDNGQAELDLDSHDGQPVPAVHRGDMVMVSNDGTTVAAGVFLPSN